MKNNRTCCLCSKEYRYCPSCGEDKFKPTYLASFCSENCKNIYTICVNYNSNKITRAEAKKQLAKCDISDFDKYTDSTKRIITEINKTRKRSKKDSD